MSTFARVLGCFAVLTSCQSRPDIRTEFQVDYTPSRISLAKQYAEAHYADYYDRTHGSPEFPGIEFEPRVLVVHYTAGTTLAGAFATFAPERLRGRPALDDAGALNVGVQFVIDRDGTIHQPMPDNYFARHCIGLNHCAIGFENIGRGDISAATLAGRGPAADHTLTLEQLDANERLIRYLKRKYPGLEVLIGHHEYRDLEQPSHPGNHLFFEADPNYRTVKRDPGPRFMAALRERLSDLLESGHGGQVFAR